MSDVNIFRKPGSRYWWAWGYDANGKRWYKSTKQTDEKAAKLATRELTRQVAADPSYLARQGVTVASSIEDVIELQTASGKAANTVRATTYHGKHLCQHLGANTALASITLADTTRYLKTRLKESASRHTISKELRTLGQAMKRATKLGKFRSQFAPEHFIPDELGKIYTPRNRWLPKAEYELLMTQLAPNPVPAKNQRIPKTQLRRADREDRRDYLAAYCFLGVRKTELFDIQPGDYDQKSQMLRVRGTKTEGSDRKVPVHPAIQAMLAARCQRSVPFPKWHKPDRDLRLACEKVGIAPVGCNDCRRTFCSWLCQANVPERVCAELLGHETTGMVRAVYGHLDQPSLAAAIARL